MDFYHHFGHFLPHWHLDWLPAFACKQPCFPRAILIGIDLAFLFIALATLRWAMQDPHTMPTPNQHTRLSLRQTLSGG